MKYLVGFIVVLCMTSCSKSDPDPVYTSLVGKWTFKTTVIPISGEFEIANFSGDLVVDNTFGQFKIKDKTYIIDTRQKMQVATGPGAAPGSFSQFWLVNTPQKAEMIFENAEYSNDFKTITAKNFLYREDGILSANYVETVVITRK